MVFGTVLLIKGIYYIVNGNQFGVVMIVFAAIGISLSIRDFIFFSKAPLNRRLTLGRHLSGMIGGYIAA
ncbi:MAG: hypothetical protein IH946_12675 [Bacteroidetes bacterium]|nr:hypothetical protein [Bacteroidota bacterium]